MPNVAQTASINQPLPAKFGARLYLIPPPKARTGLRLQKIAQAIGAADETGQPVDVDKVVAALGIPDPENYSIEDDMFGPELAGKLLDELSFEEMQIVQQAVFIWVMPGGGRKAAEEFLKDPTRALQRAKPGTRTPRAPKTSS